MRKLCGALLLTLALADAAQAEAPLPPAVVLNKVSMILRGREPSSSEVAAFASAVGTTESSFLTAYQEVLGSYMADPGFSDAVEAYHQVWWHLPHGETTQLAAYIVTQDRPYREIFEKDYVYLDGGQASYYSQAAMRTATPLPDPADPVQMVRLSPEETRFRSIFSDADWLMSVPDTATNKNRKRANYIFRTFLCENLANVLLPGAAIPAEGPHGTDPSCRGCHTRLDPMARLFDHWPPPDPTFPQLIYDGQKTALGAVVVKAADGAALTLPAQGESALGAVLLKLPQAQQCLVQKIWEFAAGPNTRLPADTGAKMLQTMAETGSFKAALKEALLHPYLWSTTMPPPLNFADVGPLLQTCAACHTAGTNPEFSATRYPFRSDAKANKALLQKIFGAAGGNPIYTRMPPGTQPPLASESVAKLRDWISLGALDEHLQPTLSDNDVKEILDD